MTKLNKIPFTIRAKRGTEAQITETNPVPYQLSGEIAYSTDTKNFFISDGTNFTVPNSDYFLKIDQTTPQTITGGAPIFTTGINLVNTHITEIRYKNTENNIAINAFRIAVNGSLSVFNMIDGFVDEYEDETGVDTANSINEVYNSGDNYYTNAEISAGSLVLQFKMNDNAATTVVADTTTNHDGTLVGGDNTQDITDTGKINQALHFNGSDDHITVADHADLDFISTSQFTIAMWVYADTLKTAGLIAKRPATAADTTFQFYTNSSNGELRFYNGVNVYSADTPKYLTATTWTHLAFVHQGDGTIDIYINGSYSTKFSYGIVKPANSALLIIGRDGESGSNHFDGLFDDVRIYSSALSSDDISDLWNGGDGTEATSGSVVSDMTLISESFTAESEPDTARLVILEEDVDAVTLNTDMNAYVSKDGGSTWDAITLSDDGDYSSGVRVLTGEVTLTSTGTDMVYKIITDNEKELKIHGTALSWN